jgi:hypothetical protein
MQQNTERIVNFAAKLPNGTAPNSRTELRQTPERNCAKMVGVAQKTKVNYHKKQK